MHLQLESLEDLIVVNNMASTLATARHPLQLAITRAAGAKAPMRMNIPLGVLSLRALQVQGVLLGLVLMNSFDDV